ncbi:MAG: DegV family protein [Anaerolineaceae bacterium]
MVTIIADTTCSIPVSELEQMGVYVLPQIIIFGDESYRDDTEIDHATFLKKLTASSALPKTAAPPPALYTPIYKKEFEAGNSMVVICPSTEMSGTVRSAEHAAQDFPNADIRIVDTRTIGSGLGSIVRCAVAWAKEGLSADEIVAKVKEMSSREHVFFLVDTLEYLKKGGRIGGAAALLGSIMQVKPILTIIEGKAEPFEKQRTKVRAIARLKELTQSECPDGMDCHVTIMHGAVKEEAEILAKECKELLHVNEVRYFDLPPAIMVHAGPGVLAISYFVPAAK